MWRRSTGCAGGQCVEVSAPAPDRVAVRSSRHPEGAPLVFDGAEWDAFIAGVVDGQFSRDALREHADAQEDRDGISGALGRSEGAAEDELRQDENRHNLKETS